MIPLREIRSDSIRFMSCAGSCMPAEMAEEFVRSGDCI